MDKNGLGGKTTQFLKIDGGDMREQSNVWAEINNLAGELGVAFKDAYSKLSKTPSGEFKKGLYKEAVAAGKSMIYVDTAVPCGVPAPSKVYSCSIMKKYDDLVSKGYTVLFVAINTDKNNCRA